MFSVKVHKKEFDKTLKAIEKHVTNLKPFWDIVELYLDKTTQETFRNSGARDGHPPWKEFSENTLFYFTKKGPKWRLRRSTAKGKGKRYSGTSKLLQSTGQYRASFETLRMNKNSMEYGSDLEEKTKHQEGDSDTNLPARPVLFITKGDRKKIINKFDFFKGMK